MGNINIEDEIKVGDLVRFVDTSHPQIGKVKNITDDETPIYTFEEVKYGALRNDIEKLSIKDGDYLYFKESNYTWVVIFKSIDYDRFNTYVCHALDTNFIDIDGEFNNYQEVITSLRPMTFEEKRILFDALEKKHLRWDEKNKIFLPAIVIRPKSKKNKTKISQSFWDKLMITSWKL